MRTSLKIIKIIAAIAIAIGVLVMLGGAALSYLTFHGAAEQTYANGDYAATLTPRGGLLEISVNKNETLLGVLDTRASVYQRYHGRWINADTFFYHSSDLGSFAVKISATDAISLVFCREYKLTERYRLYLIPPERIDRQIDELNFVYDWQGDNKSAPPQLADSLTLAVTTADGDFCDTLEIHGKYRTRDIFDEPLISEINGAAFTLNSATGAERVALIDGKITSVSASGGK